MQQQPFSRRDLTALFVGFGLVVSVIIFFAARNSSSEKIDDPISSETTMESESPLPTITPTEAKKRLLSGTLGKIIDTRSETAYQASHIPDSASMPLSKLPEYFPSQEDGEILVIAETDDAAQAETAKILSGKNVRYLLIKGGLVAWEYSGGQVVSFGNPSSPTDRSKVTFVSMDDFQKIVNGREILYAIVDVRTKEAFAKSHVPEAMNIPLAELERRRNEIPPATNIALYAETDLDAFQAAVRLFDLGMYSVKTLSVGFPEWESKGMPTEKSK